MASASDERNHRRNAEGHVQGKRELRSIVACAGGGHELRRPEAEAETGQRAHDREQGEYLAVEAEPTRIELNGEYLRPYESEGNGDQGAAGADERRRKQRPRCGSLARSRGQESKSIAEQRGFFGARTWVGRAP